MRALMAAGGGILIGVGLCWGEAKRHALAVARKEYKEQLDLHLTAIRESSTVFEPDYDEIYCYDSLGNKNPEVVAMEQDGPDQSPDAIRVGGEMVVESPMGHTEEESRLIRGYSPTMKIVDEISVFGDNVLLSIEYIDAEDYDDDDSRSKEQITILMGGPDDEPLFFMDGMQIDDWADRIGADILVDFFKLVPPGQERVLYVRNNERDEDYEVLQEFP